MTLPQAFRGQQLGLPESGPGSLAPLGPRLGAFFIDALGSALIAGLFAPRHDKTGHLPGTWSLIPFAVDYVVGILIAGRTVGMYPFRLRVIRVDRTAAVDPFRAVFRTALLMLGIPAVLMDRDGRGLHDRFTQTAVVRG